MREIRLDIEKQEEAGLAPGAARSAQSAGREFPEPPHQLRTSFMRDRDRILHSKAFRRLAHKTQVFPAPNGDHYRVRLTHTLEVSQVARTIARALRLNEDLVEAICLGHDLGHTPFGHLGEEVLSEFLGRPFRHNEQSLRIVERLESRTVGGVVMPGGLNLTWEVRDGILNHTWSMPRPATLEAQVARYADRIAYISHDIEDAVRAGVLGLGDLPVETIRVLGATSSSRIDTMVGALVDASIGSHEVRMSEDVFEVMAATRTFMFDHVYNRAALTAHQLEVSTLLSELLEHFARNPEDIPGESPNVSPKSPNRSPSQSQGEDLPVRVIDYVAGMTDRFALREHERLIRAASVLR
jgi:dGTPase